MAGSTYDRNGQYAVSVGKGRGIGPRKDSNIGRQNEQGQGSTDGHRRLPFTVEAAVGPFAMVLVDDSRANKKDRFWTLVAGGPPIIAKEHGPWKHSHCKKSEVISLRIARPTASAACFLPSLPSYYIPIDFLLGVRAATRNVKRLATPGSFRI